MTSSFTPGAPARSSRTNEAAESTCSKLSSRSSTCLSRRYSSSASRGRVSRPFLDPERVGDRPRDESRVGDAAQLDEHRVCPLPIETASPRAPGASCPIRLRPSASGAARPPDEESPDLAKLTRPPHEGRRATLRGRPGSPLPPSVRGSAATRSSAGSWSRIQRSSCRSASVGSMPSVSTSERLASRYAASASACLPER